MEKTAETDLPAMLPSIDAQQCIDELGQLEQRMQEEGYWLTGWGGRWGYGVDTLAGPAPHAGEPATVPPNSLTVPDATAPGAGAGPWGRPLWGVNAPSFQIRTLYGSAYVLALRNGQQGCMAVLSELNELYDEYVQQLQEAGVEPGEVTNWRQEMLIAAEPVQQLDSSTTNVSNITGTEIRNVEDQHLSEIDVVCWDPMVRSCTSSCRALAFSGSARTTRWSVAGAEGNAGVQYLRPRGS